MDCLDDDSQQDIVAKQLSSGQCQFPLLSAQEEALTHPLVASEPAPRSSAAATKCRRPCFVAPCLMLATMAGLEVLELMLVLAGIPIVAAGAVTHTMGAAELQSAKSLAMQALLVSGSAVSSQSAAAASASAAAESEAAAAAEQEAAVAAEARAAEDGELVVAAGEEAAADEAVAAADEAVAVAETAAEVAEEARVATDVAAEASDAEAAEAVAWIPGVNVIGEGIAAAVAAALAVDAAAEAALAIESGLAAAKAHGAAAEATAAAAADAAEAAVLEAAGAEAATEAMADQAASEAAEARAVQLEGTALEEEAAAAEEAHASEGLMARSLASFGLAYTLYAVAAASTAVQAAVLGLKHAVKHGKRAAAHLALPPAERPPLCSLASLALLIAWLPSGRQTVTWLVVALLVVRLPLSDAALSTPSLELFGALATNAMVGALLVSTAEGAAALLQHPSDCTRDERWRTTWRTTLSSLPVDLLGCLLLAFGAMWHRVWLLALGGDAVSSSVGLPLACAVVAATVALAASQPRVAAWLSKRREHTGSSSMGLAFSSMSSPFSSMASPAVGAGAAAASAIATAKATAIATAETTAAEADELDGTEEAGELDDFEYEEFQEVETAPAQGRALAAEAAARDLPPERPRQRSRFSGAKMILLLEGFAFVYAIFVLQSSFNALGVFATYYPTWQQPGDTSWQHDISANVGNIDSTSIHLPRHHESHKPEGAIATDVNFTRHRISPLNVNASKLDSVVYDVNTTWMEHGPPSVNLSAVAQTPP